MTTSSTQQTQPMFKTRISGTGSYLPKKVLTNQDLEKIVDTNDQWITERTGIKQRHIAADDEITSDLAMNAARRAIEAAGLTATDIDMILVATVTPDQQMPSTACILQAKLGARPVMAFDINAACSGFLYGTTIADQFIKAGLYKHILVVGVEILSRFINYQDRETCILFGDAAGAMVFSRAENGSDSHILSTIIQADGTLAELLQLTAGGSRNPIAKVNREKGEHWMSMKGREIFKNAVRTMVQTCQDALKNTGMTIDEVNWLIPHQANLRIIESVASYFGLPLDRAIVNVQDTGNTSAATIPVAFDQAVRDGRIQRGHNVLLTAFGAGLTSGSVLLRY